MDVRRGFTLIELVVSVGVMAVVISGGVNLFFRALRSSSAADSKRQIDSRSRVILGSLSRFLQETKISSLDGQDRSSCLTLGSLTGSDIVVTGLDGEQTTITLTAGKLASGSMILNPEDSVTVSTVPPLNNLFTWNCNGGVADQIEMQVRISTGAEVYSDFTLGLTLRNTGQ